MQPSDRSPLFLVVRSAGHAAHAPRALQQATARAGIALEFVPVRGLDAVPAAVAQALDAGRRCLVVVGPDSAVSRVADTLLSLGRANDVVLGVVPAGLSRDIAAALGISSLTAALEAIVGGHEQPFDAAQASTVRGGQAVHFIIAASAGWTPPAASAVPAPLRSLPAGAGRMLAAATVLPRSPMRSFTLSIDGIEHDGRYAAVSMHNLARWQGGLVAAPGASTSDALLDVLSWGELGRMGQLRALRGQINGASNLLDEAIERRPGRLIELSSPRPTMLIADGREAGYLPARIEVIPAALRFLSHG